MCEKCHICGKEAEYKCNTCEEYICDACTKEYDQFTCIEETMCMDCYNGYSSAKNKHYIALEKEKEKKEELRKIKNKKAMEYYKSLKQVEKRQRLKDERQKLKIKQQNETEEKIMKIWKNLYDS